MVKAIICDLDGSLMPPSSGLYVSDLVAQKLIALQKMNVLVILNSARVFQGVYPLARQIKMEQFGGYVISCNGCEVYDVLKKNTLFGYAIEKEKALRLWQICRKYDVIPGISQQDFMLAQAMPLGYQLDRNNCKVDYILTDTPEKYLETPIYKCCASNSSEKLDSVFPMLKEEIESSLDLNVIRSTDTMVDIIEKNISKEATVSRLLKHLQIDWQDTSAIGDTRSDLGCIQYSGLGVTLENGHEDCKNVCDMLVPSCYEDGCLVWLDRLIRGNQK